MTTISLTRAEANVLRAAAADEGRLHFAPTVKLAGRKRLKGCFQRDALMTEVDGQDGQYRLTPTGYEAIGLTPRPVSGATSRPNKKALLLTLLARDEAATLAELIAATGWLPHTTRAALSRIRSGGQPLAKATRPDATTAYRILPPPPVARARTRRKGEAPTPAATIGTGGRADAGLRLMARARPITGSKADRTSASLDALAGMDAAALERRWRQVFGVAPPPGLPPAQRARVIAYRLQALAYGDLDRDTARALDRFAQAREQASLGGDDTPIRVSVPVPDRRGHTPGVMLSREWAGVMHTVQVLEQGYAWNGATYDSLSRVAQLITGTKWNGPRFFGLRAKATGSEEIGTGRVEA